MANNLMHKYYRVNLRMAFPVISALLLIFLSNANAEDEHLGLTEFEVACMPCHGLDGKGDGPMAKKLKVTPPNLTQISKANGGVFPYKEIEGIIDGRAEVAAHGAREMPTWGLRYRVPGEVNESSSEIEKRASRRIKALVRYLATIQEP